MPVSKLIHLVTLAGVYGETIHTMVYRVIFLFDIQAGRTENSYL